MSLLKIALLQMSACGNDQPASLVKGEYFCRLASLQGADIALFPEMWNVGYAPGVIINTPTDLWRAPGLEPGPAAWEDLQNVWQGQSIDQESLWFTHFQALALELDMAIAITYLQRWEGFPRNAVSIINRRGEVVITYAKVHTCDWSVNEAALTPGDEFRVCTLETKDGDVQVGVMICYDREHPESARILMLKGAEIILTPNACDMEPHRLEQFKTRSYENMVGVAMANYAAPGWGHSVAYDPIAFNKQGSRNNLVIEAGESEGIYLATFDMTAIRDYRQHETWGSAFRRPHRYNELTSTSINQPFIRVNSHGERYDPTKR